MEKAFSKVGMAPQSASSLRAHSLRTAVTESFRKAEHHAGELFPRVGFVVTNLALPRRAVVRFYNKGGTSE